MTKSPAGTNLTSPSDARTEISHRIAQGIKSGAYGFQFRFITRNNQPVETWCYLYQEHQWHKRDDLAFEAEGVLERFEEFEAIAKRTIADHWSCRRIEHADRVDFELKFDRESIDAHAQNNLESYVTGLLFHGHHDSGLDARRKIRFKEH